jgi:hypothetical protein
MRALALSILLTSIVALSPSGRPAHALPGRLTDYVPESSEAPVGKGGEIMILAQNGGVPTAAFVSTAQGMSGTWCGDKRVITVAVNAQGVLEGSFRSKEQNIRGPQKIRFEYLGANTAKLTSWLPGFAGSDENPNPRTETIVLFTSKDAFKITNNLFYKGTTVEHQPGGQYVRCNDVVLSPNIIAAPRPPEIVPATGPCAGRAAC